MKTVVGIVVLFSFLLTACGSASSAALPAPPPPMSVPAGAASAAGTLGKAAGVAGVVVAESNRAASELAGTSTESVEGGWLFVDLKPPPGWAKRPYTAIKTTVEETVDVNTGTLSTLASYTCEGKNASMFMRMTYTDKQSGATFMQEIARSFNVCGPEKVTIKQVANELKKWFEGTLKSSIAARIKSIEGKGPADVRRAELVGLRGLTRIVGAVITTLSKIEANK